MGDLEKKEVRVGRVTGATPSLNKYYVLVLFDISDQKKYRTLTKFLRSRGFWVQNSVYEAYLGLADYRALLSGVEKIMTSERYFNPTDRIRVYKISGPCDAVIYGPCEEHVDICSENIFI